MELKGFWKKNDRIWKHEFLGKYLDMSPHIVKDRSADYYYYCDPN